MTPDEIIKQHPGPWTFRIGNAVYGFFDHNDQQIEIYHVLTIANALLAAREETKP